MTTGAAELGGINVDEAVTGHLIADFASETGYQIYPGTAQFEKLRKHSEEVKKQFSQARKRKATRPVSIAGHVCELVLTRSQFESLTDPIIDRTIHACEDLLSRERESWSLMDGIVLIGGSSHIPNVKQKLCDVSRLPPECVVIQDPLKAVAYGAAILANRQGGRSNSILPGNGRITGSALGFRVQEPSTGRQSGDVLIDQNQPLDTVASTTYYSSRPDQKRIVLELCQQNVEGVSKSLGIYEFPIARPQSNYPVNIQLGYDPQGLVVISASDPLTGETHHVGASTGGIDRRFQQQKSLVDSVTLSE